MSLAVLQQQKQQLQQQKQQLQQQKQQELSRPGSQQQAVMVDSEMGGGWFVEIYQKLKRKHDPTLVGCWCAAWDALTLRSLDFCENLYEVALLAKGGHGICY